MEQSRRSKRLRSSSHRWAPLLSKPQPDCAGHCPVLWCDEMGWGFSHSRVNRNRINKLIISLSLGLHHGINERKKNRGGVWSKSTLKPVLYCMRMIIFSLVVSLRCFHPSNYNSQALSRQEVSSGSWQGSSAECRNNFYSALKKSPSASINFCLSFCPSSYVPLLSLFNIQFNWFHSPKSNSKF